MNIIVCYSPSNDSPEERKDEYHEELQRVVDEIRERDMKIVIGDFNAEVGRNNQGMGNVTDVEGLGEVTNENGTHCISFCSADNLVVGGSGYGVRIGRRIINENSAEAQKKKHIPIKKKDGSVIATEDEERQCWMEHFREVINRR
ncbi:craniofacial development protein 2-like [Palaemon carinicauda]|uniref:craniofacial development protein 2-like n=1 Tax=Palaemon carinicauda TaxID=392227 RepID=UPI0035B68F96